MNLHFSDPAPTFAAVNNREQGLDLGVGYFSTNEEAIMIYSNILFEMTNSFKYQIPDDDQMLPNAVWTTSGAQSSGIQVVVIASRNYIRYVRITEE